ncbi:MAG TPA: cysteine peptidase family C39 domain-containing protein [Terrimicrobiaceae bacterium]
MTARRIFFGVLLAFLCLIAWSLWWGADWKKERPLGASGGLYFPGRLELYVPQFFQSDPRWGEDTLGSTPGRLAAEGCAVAVAAMALASYGVDVDPGRLNKFLTALPGGYTPQGWIYWEKAAEFDSGFTSRLLPHYEDLPSYFLIDRNLLERNPVIARLRYPNGITHFVVVCGKEGFDYLIRDPGRGGEKGVYPLKQFGSGIEAIRFYQKP